MNKDIPRNFTWRRFIAVLPGMMVALLPKAVCPACWPVYAGLLSSLGLGFLLETVYLIPLTGALLGLALFALAFRATRRRGYLPFWLGILATGVLMVGKFVLDSDLSMYAGAALLMLASFWNSWPVKNKQKMECPACALPARPGR